MSGLNQSKPASPPPPAQGAFFDPHGMCASWLGAAFPALASSLGFGFCCLALARSLVLVRVIQRGWDRAQ